MRQNPVNIHIPVSDHAFLDVVAEYENALGAAEAAIEGGLPPKKTNRKRIIEKLVDDHCRAKEAEITEYTRLFGPPPAMDDSEGWLAWAKKVYAHKKKNPKK